MSAETDGRTLANWPDGLPARGKREDNMLD